jgi:hypothetical protein
MNYLLDDQALISVRSRSIKLRKLDESVLAQNRTRIKLFNRDVYLPITIRRYTQITNVVVPLFMLAGAAFLQLSLRKKKWAK